MKSAKPLEVLEGKLSQNGEVVCAVACLETGRTPIIRAKTLGGGHIDYPARVSEYKVLSTVELIDGSSYNLEVAGVDKPLTVDVEWLGDEGSLHTYKADVIL